MEAKVYIYALCDPDTKEPRYVGKATDPVKRLRGHMSNVTDFRVSEEILRFKGPLTLKDLWLFGLRKANLRPHLEILATVPHAEWPEHERRWIAKLRKRGHALLNGDNGGSGSPEREIYLRELRQWHREMKQFRIDEHARIRQKHLDRYAELKRLAATQPREPVE